MVRRDWDGGSEEVDSGSRSPAESIGSAGTGAFRRGSSQGADAKRSWRSAAGIRRTNATRRRNSENEGNAPPELEEHELRQEAQQVRAGSSNRRSRKNRRNVRSVAPAHRRMRLEQQRQ